MQGPLQRECVEALGGGGLPGGAASWVMGNPEMLRLHYFQCLQKSWQGVGRGHAQAGAFTGSARGEEEAMVQEKIILRFTLIC